MCHRWKKLNATAFSKQTRQSRFRKQAPINNNNNKENYYTFDNQIENEIEIDFELQLITEIQYLLQFAYKEGETDKKMISNVTNNIINILTNEQNTY